MNFENTESGNVTPEMARQYTREEVDENKKKANKAGTIAMIAGLSVFGLIVALSIIPRGGEKKGTGATAAVEQQTQLPQHAYFEEEQRRAAASTPTHQRQAFDQAQSTTRRPDMAAELFADAEALADEEQAYQEQRQEQQRPRPTPRSHAQTAPQEYRAPREYQNRLSDEYQRVVQHFRSRANWWEISADAFDAQRIGEPLARVEAPLRDLYVGAQVSSGFSFLLSTGTRITAVTDQEVHSDYPGMFTATVTRPFELRGAKLLCQSGGINRRRIPVQVQKLTYGGQDYSLSGQVQMGRPGMEGRFRNNWAKRLSPVLFSTAIGAGFLAWTIRNNDGDRIDTRDAIAAPIIQESVGGLQREISSFGGSHPNEVRVPEGTQFDILISQNLQIGL